MTFPSLTLAAPFELNKNRAVNILHLFSSTEIQLSVVFYSIVFSKMEIGRSSSHTGSKEQNMPSGCRLFFLLPPVEMCL